MKVYTAYLTTGVLHFSTLLLVYCAVVYCSLLVHCVLVQHSLLVSTRILQLTSTSILQLTSTLVQTHSLLVQHSWFTAVSFSTLPLHQIVQHAHFTVRFVPSSYLSVRGLELHPFHSGVRLGFRV